MKTILFIAGARPNFMKISALTRAAYFMRDKIRIGLIHTGQHYDDEMSKIFFEEFKMPKPIANLGVGSMERISQTKEIINRLLPYLKSINPDLMVVVGDVNSTIASTIAAVQLGIPVAHVEAGLRSFNWQMPEEINRVITDHLSTLLFATEESAVKNLEKEGIDMSRVYLTGNVMIDTLFHFKNLAEDSSALLENNLNPKEYALVTMHRGENVDNKKILKDLYNALCEINSFIPVILPLHPRTKKALESAGIDLSAKGALRIIPSQSYSNFLKLQSCAKFIITDSGGIQEEATIFDVPCITMRTETERPITCELGTNEVAGVSKDKIVDAAKRAHNNEWKERKGDIPLWDGKAGERIMKIIVNLIADC